ncbi:MAG: beta-ketoacyl-ACP synthase [Alphaproteobacteria bacterium]|nr:beta-ketoacyl-ACP synthase [Alphaproteobacteria bacterium]MBP7729028.1 beta-ketoacyl-ACP synthase [Alphaproteobacteria bacterium]
MRRVVVTGMGGVTSLGHCWSDIRDNILDGKTGIRHLPEWETIQGMNTKLGAPLQDISFDGRWPRKKTRTMGLVSLYSVYATEKALEAAGLVDDPLLQSGRTGVAYGSSFGSTAPLAEFCELLYNRNLKNLTATSYIRLMSHTTPVNIGLFFGIKGRIIPTSSACTSGSLAIGYAAETIRYGLQDVMIAGGAEELCPSMAAVFDALYATSTRNTTPELTPCPYDVNRDGLVIGEGAATLVLEDYDHAMARKAPIYAEIIGFGTNTDGNHVTQPTAETMEVAIRLALQDARLAPADIGFISGHGTATEHGDIAETLATYAVFQDKTPLHSLKSYFGHTLGACGSIEAWLGIEMMRNGWFVPTANLKNIDDRCAPLDYVMHEKRCLNIDTLMSNNFAFGGINTSLIFKRV